MDPVSQHTPNERHLPQGAQPNGPDRLGQEASPPETTTAESSPGPEETPSSPKPSQPPPKPPRTPRRGGSSVGRGDRKSTRLNSSHVAISYAVFCLKKKKQI